MLGRKLKLWTYAWYGCNQYYRGTRCGAILKSGQASDSLHLHQHILRGSSSIGRAVRYVRYTARMLGSQMLKVVGSNPACPITLVRELQKGR